VQALAINRLFTDFGFQLLAYGDVLDFDAGDLPGHCALGLLCGCSDDALFAILCAALEGGAISSAEPIRAAAAGEQHGGSSGYCPER